MENYFYSIGQTLQSTLKIKRSVFICTLEHVKTIDAAKGFISRVTKENKRATHNFWAYIV
ncbi:MAG: YigZ family protein, partial [Desulfobacula sp.]|nr:YigZ family protein [Desulfobacula sp.]